MCSRCFISVLVDINGIVAKAHIFVVKDPRLLWPYHQVTFEDDKFEYPRHKISFRSPDEAL